MPQPRNRQVCLDDTPYYHCISRCVRRAFLCGKDARTGFDFEHRRQWIVDRIKLLCSVFATWRERLCNISWIMRCINEPIARMANAEDHCTGRFWEGRFTSQALLDERAVLACMTYVDLNPIRAAMARTPEQSEYTSIRERVVGAHDTPLLSFNDQAEDGIPFKLKDYLELVDWAGRAIKENKRGYIPSGMPPILTRLGMQATLVFEYLAKHEKHTSAALGPVSMLREKPWVSFSSFLLPILQP